MKLLWTIFAGMTLLATGAGAQNGAVPAGASAARPDPAAVFQRARTRLLADAQRMPRYTCEQNIMRRFYRAESDDPQSCTQLLARQEKRKHELKASSWDRLQLDVAIADNGEIHSWPGAPKFNDEEIRRLVSNGPFGTGDFHSFITGIFGGTATIKFAGIQVQNGRTLLAYTFTVPQIVSNYRIALAGATVLTAYDGSFLLDPATADLVQLDVRTAELPEATKSCQAFSRIQYERLEIHGHEVLIPRETGLRLIYRDGREAEATTSYANCHEYTSKAVLRFDEADLTTAGAAPVRPAQHAAEESPFPPGSDFGCRILTPIDSDTPAGTPVEGILRSPLRGKDKNILAPPGAHIRGRVVRLADHKSILDYFEVGIRLESVRVNGVDLPLYATLADPEQPPILHWPGVTTQELLADLPPAPPGNTGVFFFVREKLRLRQIDAEWVTSSAQAEKEGGNATASTLQAASVKSFVLTIDQAQQATSLLSEDRGKYGFHGSSLFAIYENFPDLPAILAHRRKAIGAGQSVNAEILNKLYAGWGDEFKNHLMESLTLFVRGCEMRAEFAGDAQSMLYQSQILNNHWVDWYSRNHSALEAVVNNQELQAEWAGLTPGAGLKKEPVEIAGTSSEPAFPPPAKTGPVSSSATNPPPAAALPAPNPAAAQAGRPQSSFPSGMVLMAELAKPLDAKKNKIGDKVSAKITRKLSLPGHIALAPGTILEGHVSQVQAKSKGTPGSMLEITFDRARSADGHELALQATLQAIGRPLPQAPAAMDSSIISAGTGAPGTGAASDVSAPHGSPSPPPVEPPQVSNPDADASMPGENEGALTPESQGVIGLPGLALSASPQASVITSAKGNVHLGSGTQLVLKTQ